MENNCISPRLFAFAIAMLAVFSFGIKKVMAQEWDHEYVPFVEEGKIWNCVHTHWYDAEYPDGYSVDFFFTMKGDTLIGEKNYKKVYCQFEEHYGDKEQHYFCSVREDTYQVFIVESESTEEQILCDFSHPKETLHLEIGNQKVTRSRGDNPMMCPTKQHIFYLNTYNDNGEQNDVDGEWFEGVGTYIGNPFAVYGEGNTFKKNISVVSCMKDKTIIFDEEWMVLPLNNIESICHNTSTQTIKTFDFQGRRLTDTPHRGMYIRDGRKYVVK